MVRLLPLVRMTFLARSFASAILLAVLLSMSLTVRGAVNIDPTFDPRGGADAAVLSIVPAGSGKTLVTGLFTRYAGVSRAGIALVNEDGTLDPAFSPQIEVPATGGGVAVATVDSRGRIYIGGVFTRVDGASRPGLARLDASGRLDASFNPELPADAVVVTVALAPDGGVFAGGNFRASTATTPALSLIKLRDDGRIDPSFPAPAMRGQDNIPFVNKIVALPDGGVFVGGDFTEVSGSGRPIFCRLRADGTVDGGYPMFPFYADVWVSDVDVLPDGTVYVSGVHLTESGGHIVRLLPSGALDPNFKVGVRSSGIDAPMVNSLQVLADGRLLVAGNFDGVGGVPRAYVARLFDDGAVDTSFDPTPNGEVVAVLEDDTGRFWLGGLFSAVNGQSRAGVARLGRNGDGPLLRLPPIAVDATAGSNVVLPSALFGADTVQWFRDGVAIPGATRSTLALAVASPADSGAYTVAASNAFGAVTSSAFTINVTDPRLGAVDLVSHNREPFNTTLPLAFLADGGVLAFEGGTSPRLRRYGSDFRLTGTSPVTGFRFARIDTAVADIQQRVYLRGLFEHPDGSTRQIVRLHPDGRHDTSFDARNVVLHGKFLPQTDGGLLGIGDAGSFTRLLPNGAIDSAFSRRQVAAFALQPDGRILYGIGRDLSLGPINLGRLHPDGTPDPSLIPPTVTVVGRNNVRWPVDSVEDIIVLPSGDIAVSVNGDFAFTSVLWLSPQGAHRATYTEPNVQQRVFRFFAADAEGAVYASGVSPGAMRLPPGGPPQRIEDFFSVVEAWNSPLHGAIVRTQLQFANETNRGVARIGTHRPGPFRFVNLSSRGTAGVGDSSLILGFVITGTAETPFLVRGVGPTLQSFGVAGAESDPAIELFRSGTLIAANDDWTVGQDGVATLASQVGAFPLGTNSRDAALAPSLSGGAFTAVIRSRSQAAGVALGEIYLAGSGATALSNLSIRGHVAGAGSPLIGGLSIQGESPRWVLVRAVGPGLAPFGVESPLPNPVLRLVRDGVTVAQNEDWESGNEPALVEAAARKAGAFALPRGSTDAVVYALLPPGNYTAVVSDRENRTGPALLEVYIVTN